MNRFTPALKSRYRSSSDDQQEDFIEGQQSWQPSHHRKHQMQPAEWKHRGANHQHNLHDISALKVPNYYQQRRNTPVQRRRKFREEFMLPSLVERPSNTELVKSAVHGLQNSQDMKRRHRTTADQEQLLGYRLQSRISGSPKALTSGRLLKSTKRSTGRVSVHNESYLQQMNQQSTNPEQPILLTPAPKATLKNVMALQNNFARLSQQMKNVRPLMFPTSRRQLIRYYQQFKQTNKLMQQFHELIE